jgi:hypothetical protein
MNLRIPDSPLKRMAVAIGAAAAIMVVGGLIYLLIAGETPPAKIDGLRIVAAANAYTRALVAKRQPIPKSVPLNELLKRGYLKPADVAGFQGLDATLVLASDADYPRNVLMRVHMPDGTDFVLLGDGSTQQVAR